METLYILSFFFSFTPQKVAKNVSWVARMSIIPREGKAL